LISLIKIFGSVSASSVVDNNGLVYFVRRKWHTFQRKSGWSIVTLYKISPIHPSKFFFYLKIVDNFFWILLSYWKPCYKCSLKVVIETKSLNMFLFFTDQSQPQNMFLNIRWFWFFYLYFHMVKQGLSLYYQNSFCKQNHLVWESIFAKIKLGGINLLMEFLGGRADTWGCKQLYWAGPPKFGGPIFFIFFVYNINVK